MTRRIVLLGTGTGVGKTYVGAALTAALNELGTPARALKPIESGVRPGAPSDAEALSHAAPSLPNLARHCYALPEPLSPHLAARRAGLTIDLDRVCTWVTGQISHYTTLQYVLVETAGGVFSPVHDTATNYELAEHLGEAIWVLVAPDRLGVLHDVTACLAAMERRGRRPDAVILSGSQPDSSTGTNAAELTRLGITHIDAVVDHGGPEGVRPFAARLARGELSG